MVTMKPWGARSFRTRRPTKAGATCGLPAFVKLLLFDLAVLIGVWIVHQTEYLLEYGHRFNAVMAESPHHLYMVPAAAVLSLAASVAAVIALFCLLAYRHRARESACHLSPRVARHVNVLALPVSARSVFPVASGLFVAQVGVYGVQENLESWFSDGSLPGTTVLVGAQHLTVLPLHALLASVLAILLVATTTRLRHAERMSHVATALAALLRQPTSSPSCLRPSNAFTPSLQPLTGFLGLRSPPLST